MRARDTLAWLLAAALVAVLPATASGQDHQHDHEQEGHHHGLHFSHPMISPSVSPDRKIRLDWARFDFPGQAENTVQVAGEWSLTRALSVEAAIPYSATETEVGFTEVSVKMANYAFEDRGVSLGYGLSVALPTSGDAPPGTHDDTHGDEDHAHGNPATRSLRPAPGMGGPGRVAGDGVAGVRPTLGEDHYELEPFLNLGWKTGPWEVVGFTRFSVPTADGDESAGNPHLAYNASILLHVSSRLQALLEYDGLSEVGEPGSGHREGYVSPGLKVRLLEGRRLWLGGAVSFPVTEEESFDTRIRISLFQHF